MSVPSDGARAATAPLACVPGAIATADRSAHFALAEKLFTVALRQRRTLPNGYAYRFGAESVDDLLRWLANERRCCPFLTFAIEVAPAEGSVSLTLTGPDGTRDLLDAELPAVSATLDDRGVSPPPHSEPVLYAPLSVANLAAEGAASRLPYRNVVISPVNESCLRLSAFEGDYRWHFHPGSDELFVVVDGRLAIDLADGTTLMLGPWDTVTIPAGTLHRTRALPRAVNLCFEDLENETTFVDPPSTFADAKPSP